MSVFVQGFHRTDDNNGTSVIFTDNLNDVDTLGTELRRQGIYFACGDDVSPVVLMLDTGQEAAGNCLGTVAVAGQDDHPQRTIEFAIMALEAVLAGMRESGHTDD